MGLEFGLRSIISQSGSGAAEQDAWLYDGKEVTLGMTMSRSAQVLKSTLIGAAVTAFLAGTSVAATVNAVWTGTTLPEGNPFEDEYGAVDDSFLFGNERFIANLPITISLRYSTAIGERNTIPGVFDMVTADGDPLPVLSVAVTVKGVTVQMPLGSDGDVQLTAQDKGYYNNVYEADQVWVHMTYNDADRTYPQGLETPFSWSFGEGSPSVSGDFNIMDTGARITFSGLTVTVEPSIGEPAPVPLPAAGVLLLSAGAALAMARSRRQRATSGQTPSA